MAASVAMNLGVMVNEVEGAYRINNPFLTGVGSDTKPSFYQELKVYNDIIKMHNEIILKARIKALRERNLIMLSKVSKFETDNKELADLILKLFLNEGKIKKLHDGGSLCMNSAMIDLKFLGINDTVSSESIKKKMNSGIKSQSEAENLRSENKLIRARLRNTTLFDIGKTLISFINS